MSWWIYLEDVNGERLDTQKLRSEGGVYRLCGQSEAELNVTYNYGCLFDFKSLNGMEAADAAPYLLHHIKKLGQNEDPDYWKPTQGNVRRALITLFEFADYAIRKEIKAYFKVS